MPPARTFTLRIPQDVLTRLRAEAASRGVTVTDVLLSPWRGDGPARSLPQAETLAVAARRRRAKPPRYRLEGRWKTRA